MDLLEELMRFISDFTDFDEVTSRIMTKHPGFFGNIRYGKLPDDIFRDYELKRDELLQEPEAELTMTSKELGKSMAWILARKWSDIMYEINKTKNKKMTYKFLKRFIVVDPITRKPLFSEQTIRN